MSTFEGKKNIKDHDEICELCWSSLTTDQTKELVNNAVTMVFTMVDLIKELPGGVIALVLNDMIIYG